MTSNPAVYLPRMVDSYIDLLLTGLPAVLVVGPRASGKTTTARRRGASIIRLDRPGVAEAVRLDVDAALSVYDEPIVIDEWQLVPEILGAVKRAVDDDPRERRFILTGSVGADLTSAGWPATGRVVRVPMWGLTQRELLGQSAGKTFLERLMNVGAEAIRLPNEVPDIRAYIELALRGMFPEVVKQPSARLRRAWLASYIDQLVTRDVAAAGVSRDPVRLRRYMHAVAVNSAGSPEHKTLYDAAQLDRATGTAYDGLLQSIFVTEHVPAWKASKLGRLIGVPKRYITDPALFGPLLGVEPRSVMKDADLLGRLIDTFVAAQLRPELTVNDDGPRLFHLRDTNGRHEIDLIAETADGRVAAFEIKAGAAPGAASARHLIWLRDRLGDRFTVGVVFHTGPLPFKLDDRIYALPICAIWGG